MKTNEVLVSLTEKYIERHYAVDPVTRQKTADPALDVMQGAVRAARKAAEACVVKATEIRSNRLNCEIGNELAVARASRKLCEAASKELDQAREKVERFVGDLMKKISAPAEPNDVIAESREAELRAALGKLDHRARAQRISEAIRAEDNPLIGAVLRGRAIVTGIEPAELEGYRAAWQRVRVPAEVDRISRLKSALKDLDRTGRLFKNFMDGIADQNAVRRAEQLESGSQVHA